MFQHVRIIEQESQGGAALTRGIWIESMDHGRGRRGEFLFCGHELRWIGINSVFLSVTVTVMAWHLRSRSYAALRSDSTCESLPLLPDQKVVVLSSVSARIIGVSCSLKNFHGRLDTTASEFRHTSSKLSSNSPIKDSFKALVLVCVLKSIDRGQVANYFIVCQWGLGSASRLVGSACNG